MLCPLQNEREYRNKIQSCNQIKDSNGLNRLGLAVVVVVLVLVPGNHHHHHVFPGAQGIRSVPELLLSRPVSLVHSSKNNNHHHHRRRCNYQWIPRGGARANADVGTDNDDNEDDSRNNHSQQHQNIDTDDTAVDEDHKKNNPSDDTDSQTLPLLDHLDSDNNVENAPAAAAESTPLSQRTIHIRWAKRRRTSDMIQSLLERSLDSSSTIISTNPNQQEESNELRQLITDRAQDYVQSLQHHHHHHHHKNMGQTSAVSPPPLPHPKKLLHTLAPKIPAIHYSPNVMWRIQSATRSDMDAGVAACLLATLARVCELYDRHHHHPTSTSHHVNHNQDESSDSTSHITTARPSWSFSSSSSALDIIHERQFEQLVECVLCGLDMKRLLLLHKDQNDKDGGDERSSAIQEDSMMFPIELEEEEHDRSNERFTHDDDVQVWEQGLSLRDACRAAWGVAILGGHHYDSMGGETVPDIFVALSLRVRELLIFQFDRLCRAEALLLHAVVVGKDELILDDDAHKDDRFVDHLAEEIAEDAATAMWTFACVRACTGIRTIKLFETCSFLLCQDPRKMRRRRQRDNHNDETTEASNHGRTNLENADKDVSSSINTETNEKEDDEALLDWLSPNEITDMLWALALHGSSESYLSTKEDVVLSETATTLREIAFDRLLHWLRQDLDAFGGIYQQAEDGAAPHLSGLKPTGQDADAASSPFVSEDTDVNRHALHDDTITSDNLSEGSADEETTTVADGGIHSLSIDKQPVPGSNSLEQPFDVQHLQGLQALVKNGDKGAIASRKGRFFSSHDLCSIVWAVTDLRDSSRAAIVELVTAIFEAQGPTSTDQLEGGDLTNLVWAVARHASEQQPELRGTSSVVVLTTWAAQSALRKIKEKTENRELDHEDVLLAFQPPELGRIIWSIATTLTAYRDIVTSADRRDMGELFKATLLSAGSRLSIFATEDLARIAWAFLEICNFDDYLSDPDVLDALAKILVTIESSVLRWEKGHCSSIDAESSKKVNESILFATFFGKSRMATPLSDQRIGEVRDEEDESFEGGKSGATTRRSRLPLLRDLSIDPCTLCKVANGFAKLSTSRPFVKGGETLSRIAVRVLVSENGLLMKESSFHDIVRLLEAVAAGEGFDLQSQFIARLFARRIVRMLNEDLHPRRESKVPSAFLSSLSPTEKSVMLDSLGRLGVRFTSDKDSRSAYKRLRLVINSPILSPAQLSGISTSCLTKLLRGLVVMDVMSCNNDFLLSVLTDLETKVKELDYGRDLCCVIESLSTIGQSLEVSDLAQPSPLNTATESGIDDIGTNESNINTLGLSQVDNSTAVVTELRSICRRLLSSVASQAISLVPKLEVDELRRIMDVYTFLPVQEDALVKCIEEDVAERKIRWKEQSLSNLRASVKEAIQLAQNSFSKNGVTDDDSKRPKKSFLQAMLFKDKTTQRHPIEASHSGAIQEILEKLLLIDKEMEGDQLPGPSFDSTILAIQAGCYYSLCCCEELVASYRRIEFNTGTHMSRYDKHRRRDIAKRVLSRLLPSPSNFHD